MKHITLEYELELRKRLVDLEDKQSFMRSPKNPDGFPAPILLGRIEGQIGELKRVLERMEK